MVLIPGLDLNQLICFLYFLPKLSCEQPTLRVFFYNKKLSKHAVFHPFAYFLLIFKNLKTLNKEIVLLNIDLNFIHLYVQTKSKYKYFSNK